MADAIRIGAKRSRVKGVEPEDVPETLLDLARLCMRKRVPFNPEFQAALEKYGVSPAEYGSENPFQSGPSAEEFAAALEERESRLAV